MDDPSRCSRCWFPTLACICADIPSVVTRTHFVILRHHLERFRSSNSGRLAHLALPNSRIIDVGGRSDAPTELEQAELRSGAWLMFPEGAPAEQPPAPLPQAVIVLDASWSQARRMRRKLSALRGLPTLHLSVAAVSPDRLRKSPGAGRVSTIEAIAQAVRLLEDEPAATALEALFARAVWAARKSGRRARQEILEV